MMLFLALVLAILNLAARCNSAAIDPHDFNVTKPVKLNESVWINCTGHVDGVNGETFEAIELLKDGKQFYVYYQNETNKDQQIKTTAVSGIDQSQMDTSVDRAGRVRIKNPTDSIKGKYHCRYWYLIGGQTRNSKNSGDRIIDTVIVGPTPSPNNPATTVPPTTNYNETAVLNGFDASDPIYTRDDFSLNCSHSLLAGQTLVSLNISKDGEVFYAVTSDNKGNQTVKLRNANGINFLQISYAKNSTGSVIIKAAEQRMSGLYKCELTIKVANGTTKSAYLTRNISVTANKWSPVIRFDTPISVTKGEDFWLNCTYNPTISEKLLALNWSKDGETFYSYANNRTRGIGTSDINQFKIITSKEIGSVKLESATQSYRGKYRCSVTAQNDTVEGTSSSEAFIDYSEVRNQYIASFQVPSKFGKWDDILINCSVATLESGVNLTALTISKDEKPFYTYTSSTGNIDVNKLDVIPDTNQIKTNKEQIGVVRILHASPDLRGQYKCEASVVSAKTGAAVESASKYLDYTDEWKPDISRFYVPDSIKRGSKYFWVNCSLAGLTEKEVSNFLLKLTKDSETFYNISSNSNATTYPVRGLESYQFDTTGQYNASVRVTDPTVEARGIYRCSLTTTRGSETKTVYKEYFVDFNHSAGLIISASMYFVIAIAFYFNL